MSWKLVTDDWRLKLLALGLAILMLGAVAFSQNPPTSGTLKVGLTYTNLPSNLVLLNPPSNINVTYSGLSGVISQVTVNNLSAKVDASHATPGAAVKLNVIAASTVTGVTVQVAPIVVAIETLTTKEIPIEVKANAAPGWSITSAVATCPASSKPTPCAVHFTGPASWTTNLHAYVTYPGAGIQANTNNSPNQTVQLQNNNGYFDSTTCSKVTPACSLDVTTVSIHVDAVAGSTSSTVALLDAPPSHAPANGYRVTAITITPNTVIISGDPVALGKVRSIMLPSVDLTGRTSDATFSVAIRYPDGISGSVANATVTYSISANPNASPSPGA